MHKTKQAAHRLHWNDDAKYSKFNPWGRIKYAQKRSQDVDDGGLQVPTHMSESCVIPTDEENRRYEARGGAPGPLHSNSMPLELMKPNGSPLTPRDPAVDLSGEPLIDPDRKEKSQDSGAPTSETVLAEKPYIEGHPRRRTTKLFGLCHKEDKGKESLQREPSSLSKGSKQTFTAGGQLRATILNSWINVLFVFIPVGIALHFTTVSPVVIFVANFIAIIPLAAMLSYATEEIALRTGETIGGLLNASFGNAVELIVSIIALVHNEVLIVQTSLIGSMLSNLLLVMGMCFFFGGINRVEQFFNVTVAQTAASLLSLAVASLIIPTAFANWSDGDATIEHNHITALSRGTAILLLIVYGAYLYFQLKTHTAMYNEPSKKVERRNVKVEGDATKEIIQMGAQASRAMGSDLPPQASQRDPGDEPDRPQLSIAVAIATLCISTALVGICAEFLVDSINALVEIAHLSKTFVGLILLPIVGNAAEHATAVTVAIKDKMDLAIGVAVGSSMQIALLLIPFAVVLGWCMGNDDMNLQFDGFQIAILFVSVLLVNYLIGDGKSHWLEGVLLMTLYLIIAVAAWYYPAKQQTSSKAT